MRYGIGIGIDWNIPCQSRMAIKRLNTRHTFWPITPVTPPYTTKYGKRTGKAPDICQELGGDPGRT